MASPYWIAYSVFKQRHHVAVDETSTRAKCTTKTVLLILPAKSTPFQSSEQPNSDFDHPSTASKQPAPWNLQAEVVGKIEFAKNDFLKISARQGTWLRNPPQHLRELTDRVEISQINQS